MSISIGKRDFDIRYDPIDAEFKEEEILGSNGPGNAEVHQALPIEGLPGKVGFSPNEMPMRRTDLPASGIIVYEVTANNALTGWSQNGDELVQVQPPVGGQPGIGEYAVDIYNSIGYLNTGRFFVNPANVNKYYRIHRYYGLGSINSVRNTRYIEDLALAQKLSRDGSLAMTGNLNFGNFKGVNLQAGTASSDAVNKQQLDAKVDKSGDTMTGNLTIPAGTAAGHAVNKQQLDNKALNVLGEWTDSGGSTAPVTKTLPSSGTWLLLCRCSGTNYTLKINNVLVTDLGPFLIGTNSGHAIVTGNTFTLEVGGSYYIYALRLA